MLEVINGFLLVYFTVLCAISVLIPHLVKPIAACFSRPSNEEQSVWAEIIKLKAEQKSIPMKEEFAAFSKLQRKINKLENQFKDGSQTRIHKNIAIKGTIQLVLQVGVGLVTVLSVIWFRREPIVALKGDLFPLGGMLRYPSDTPNAISTHMWVLLSNVSMRSLFKPLIS